MVIDTSALLAVLFGESDGEALAARVAGARDPSISAGTLIEASIVMYARSGADGVRDLDELLAAAGVRCVAVDLAQARTAREAFARYGKGQAPAGLNLGDCFAYALAKAAKAPLLFKGHDLARTDVDAAFPRDVLSYPTRPMVALAAGRGAGNPGAASGVRPSARTR